MGHISTVQKKIGQRVTFDVLNLLNQGKIMRKYGNENTVVVVIIES